MQMILLLRETVKTIHEEKRAQLQHSGSYLDRSKIIFCFMYTLQQKEETRGNFESLIRKDKRERAHQLRGFTFYLQFWEAPRETWCHFLGVQIYPLLPRLVYQPLQLYMKIANHRSSALYMERIIIIMLAWLWKKQFVHYSHWNILVWNEERKSQNDSADLWHKCTYILDFLLRCSENFKVLEGTRQWFTLPPDCSLPDSFQMAFELNFGFEVAYNMYSICYSPINLPYKHSWPLRSYYLGKFDIASVMVTSSEINGINQEGYPATNIVISHSFLTDTIYHQC